MAALELPQQRHLRPEVGARTPGLHDGVTSARTTRHSAPGAAGVLVARHTSCGAPSWSGLPC